MISGVGGLGIDGKEFADFDVGVASLQSLKELDVVTSRTRGLI